MHLVADRFDFPVPRNSVAVVCTRVWNGAPALYVANDAEGYWQFVCGGDHGPTAEDPPVVACIECVVARDLSLNEIAALPVGTVATRDAVGTEWKRVP